MSSQKPQSEKDLNNVFLLRKKVGNYKSIPLDVKAKMMDLFLKVFLAYFS